MTHSSRRVRRLVAVAAAAAGLAALSAAPPADAKLYAGIPNGGCVKGLQVGHFVRNGDVIPICRTWE